MSQRLGNIRKRRAMTLAVVGAGPALTPIVEENSENESTRAETAPIEIHQRQQRSRTASSAPLYQQSVDFFRRTFSPSTRRQYKMQQSSEDLENSTPFNEVLRSSFSSSASYTTILHRDTEIPAPRNNRGQIFDPNDCAPKRFQPTQPLQPFYREDGSLTYNPAKSRDCDNGVINNPPGHVEKDITLSEGYYGTLALKNNVKLHKEEYSTRKEPFDNHVIEGSGWRNLRVLREKMEQESESYLAVADPNSLDEAQKLELIVKGRLNRFNKLLQYYGAKDVQNIERSESTIAKKIGEVRESGERQLEELYADFPSTGSEDSEAIGLSGEYVEKVKDISNSTSKSHPMHQDKGVLTIDEKNYDLVSSSSSLSSKDGNSRDTQSALNSSAVGEKAFPSQKPDYYSDDEELFAYPPNVKPAWPDDWTEEQIEAQRERNRIRTEMVEKALAEFIYEPMGLDEFRARSAAVHAQVDEELREKERSGDQKAIENAITEYNEDTQTSSFKKVPTPFDNLVRKATEKQEMAGLKGTSTEARLSAIKRNGKTEKERREKPLPTAKQSLERKIDEQCGMLGENDMNTEEAAVQEDAEKIYEMSQSIPMHLNIAGSRFSYITGQQDVISVRKPNDNEDIIEDTQSGVEFDDHGEGPSKSKGTRMVSLQPTADVWRPAHIPSWIPYAVPPPPEIVITNPLIKSLDRVKFVEGNLVVDDKKESSGSSSSSSNSENEHESVKLNNDGEVNFGRQLLKKKRSLIDETLAKLKSGFANKSSESLLKIPSPKKSEKAPRKKSAFFRKTAYKKIFKSKSEETLVTVNEEEGLCDEPHLSGVSSNTSDDPASFASTSSYPPSDNLSHDSLEDFSYDDPDCYTCLNRHNPERPCQDKENYTNDKIVSKFQEQDITNSRQIIIAENRDIAALHRIKSEGVLQLREILRQSSLQGKEEEGDRPFTPHAAHPPLPSFLGQQPPIAGNAAPPPHEYGLKRRFSKRSVWDGDYTQKEFLNGVVSNTVSAFPSENWKGFFGRDTVVQVGFSVGNKREEPAKMEERGEEGKFEEEYTS